MALANYVFTLILDVDGAGNINVGKNVPIEIRNADAEAALATIYSDADGLSPISQPGATTNELGKLSFWVERGLYQVYVNGSANDYIAVNGYVVAEDLDSQAIQAKIDELTIQANEEIDEGVKKAVQSTGYFPVTGSFEDGGTIAEYNQVLLLQNADGSNGAGYYSWAGALPKTVAAASTPSTTGGIGNTAWSYRADATVRSDLAQQGAGKGVDMVNGAEFNVDSLINLFDVPFVDGKFYSNGGFYPDTVVGGGRWKAVASEPHANFTGGTVVTIGALEAWRDAAIAAGGVTKQNLIDNLNVLLNWTGTGTGAFVRIHSIPLASPELDPYWFGAVGNGQVDEYLPTKKAMGTAELQTIASRVTPWLTFSGGTFLYKQTLQLNGGLSWKGQGYGSRLCFETSGAPGIIFGEKGGKLKDFAVIDSPSDPNHLRLPSEVFVLGTVPVSGNDDQTVYTTFKDVMFESVWAENCIIENRAGYGTLLDGCILHNSRANIATIAFRQKTDELKNYSYQCILQNTDITRSYNTDNSFGTAILQEGGMLTIRSTTVQSNDTAILSLRANEQPVLNLDNAYFENCQNYSLRIGDVDPNNTSWVGARVSIEGGRFHKGGTALNKIRLHGGDIYFENNRIFQGIDYETTKDAKITLGPKNDRWIYEKLLVSNNAVAVCSPGYLFSAPSSTTEATEIRGVNLIGNKPYEVEIIHRNGFSGDNTHLRVYRIRPSASGAFSAELVSSSAGADSVSSLTYTFSAGSNGALLATPSALGFWNYLVK